MASPLSSWEGGRSSHPLPASIDDRRDSFEGSRLELAAVSREVLLDAAGLRAHYRSRTPDAIVVATGLRSRATAAITNDDSWRDLPSLKILTLSELID